MKKVYRREIRHIIANHLIKNKSTAYFIRSKSIVRNVIRKLINHKWVDCISIDGPFMFVRPSKKIVDVFQNI